MMTLDAVRTAMLSDQPWARLDELVRAELATGRLVRQVGDELRGMQSELEDTLGLSDDGGDALLDTLESLHQMGPRKYWYVDPPRLPTADEVGALPRWARVALAARSARRILPLFRYELPDAPASHLRILEGAVESAEWYAANTVTETDVVHDWARYATDVLVLNQLKPNPLLHILAAINAAYAAEHKPRAAWVAIHQSVAAAAAYADLSATVRHDLAHLASLAESDRWTDDTAVSPLLLGPLWPLGRQDGWPTTDDLLTTSAATAPRRPERVPEPVT